jgi:hypothetical protein
MHQIYDPDQLARDVEKLLTARGLQPVRVGEPKAVVAAGMLLRALGIMPGIDGAVAAARSADKIWTEWDEHTAH